MRLSAEYRNAIKQAAIEAFGADTTVRLFGSRVDDTLRGGDINIHVETAPECADFDHEVRFRTLVWKLTDESQIDVVVSARGAEPRWIDRAAMREGILL